MYRDFFIFLFLAISSTIIARKILYFLADKVIDWFFKPRESGEWQVNRDCQIVRRIR